MLNTKMQWREVNGLFVPARSPTQLAEAIERLCHEKALLRAMQSKNYHVARAKYMDYHFVERVGNVMLEASGMRNNHLLV